MDGEDAFELLQIRLHGGLHVRDIAACRRAPRRPSCVARWTWPREAAAAGLRSKEPNRLCHCGPSSACMRRFTKAAPMGGASLCSFCSSAAYSGGMRSGMVASSCATFMIGPFRPPSAWASAAAFEASLPIAPEQPRSRHARRHAAHIGADAGIAGSARGEAVRFAVGIGHDVRSLALKPESLRYGVRRQTLGRCGVRPSGCRRRQKATWARSGP